MKYLGERPRRQWPAWIDDVLGYEPIAELEAEWRAAIGDAITKILDKRARGSEERICPCCGARRVVAREDSSEAEARGEA